MKSYIVCLTVLFAGAVYVQADTSSIPNWDVLLKQALDNIEVGMKKFQEVTGMQTEFDKTKVETFLKTNFGKTADKIQEQLKNLEKESGKYGEEFKKSVDKLVSQFNETVKNFNTPELQGKVQKLQETASAGFKKTAEQLTEVAKTVGITVPPSIQKTLNEIYEEINKSLHKVHEKANQLVADAQAELKKKQAKSS